MKGRRAPLLDLEEETTMTEPTANTGNRDSESISSSEKPKIPPSSFRLSLLERLLSTPLVSFLTCGGGNHDLNSSHLDAHQKSSLFRESFLQNGAPNAIVKAMKQFPQNARIQRMGCKTLADIMNPIIESPTRGSKSSFPWKERVMKAEGLDAILKAMRIHLSDAHIQRLGCLCLYSLVVGDYPTKLLEQGAIGSVLAAMEHHIDNEDVLSEACKVLLGLTHTCPSEACDLIRQKLGGMVLAKMEHQFRGKNGDIHKKAGEILRRLYL